LKPEATLSNVALMVVPIIVKPVTMRTLMRLAINAYSMAVAPHSSRAKALR
jgi:hypothetical protein